MNIVVFCVYNTCRSKLRVPGQFEEELAQLQENLKLIKIKLFNNQSEYGLCDYQYYLNKVLVL